MNSLWFYNNAQLSKQLQVDVCPIIFPVSVQSLVEHIKYMRETHIEYTETFTARNAHLIETKRSPLKRTLIVTTFTARNAHLIETKRCPLKRTLIVTTFDEQLVSLSSHNYSVWRAMLYSITKINQNPWTLDCNNW